MLLPPLVQESFILIFFIIKLTPAIIIFVISIGDLGVKTFAIVWKEIGRLLVKYIVIIGTS
jgi:hypothetical protein